MRIVPDTSVIIKRALSELLEKGRIEVKEILIPRFVVEELQSQASKGLRIGFEGLEEIKHLRELGEKLGFKVEVKGRLQTLEEIRLAKSGRIDALIIEFAREEDAVLYTCDVVQSLVAEAEGVKTVYIRPYEAKKLTIESMLTEDTLSLHLKEKAPPLAKRGRPGNFRLVRLREEPLTAEELEGIIQEIVEAARYQEDSFIELASREATVVQLGNMRIAIARPPFSDGIEVTVVRPIVKLTLDDYRLSEQLKKRIERGEGIIIAGPPGSGKSTLASSIAEFYKSLGKVVKTIEQPRDLQVSDEITQYTKLHGSVERTAELLLLVRPDYTIFDEVRTNSDFATFVDMRLAGIGMVGVVHASSAIDAIQRLIRRVELGMIPHVVDTVIFVKDGKIEEVYKLELVVKVPTGMVGEDFIRPVVEVRDFETNELKYEIYTFGEENVIVEVTKASERSPIERLAAERILQEIKRFERGAEVEVRNNVALVRVNADAIPKLIGKKGKNISKLEERLGIKIEVLPKGGLGRKVDFNYREVGKNLVFTFSSELIGKNVSFYDGEECIATLLVGKKGEIKLRRDSEIGRRVLSALLKSRLSIYAS